MGQCFMDNPGKSDKLVQSLQEIVLQTLVRILAVLFLLALPNTCLNAQGIDSDATAPQTNIVGSWRVLAGPEREKGNPVKILDDADGTLILSVHGRRGTVMRQFAPIKIPATVSFHFQSTYDPDAREILTELFGTGDFRIFVGSQGSRINCQEGQFTAYEGFQFRIFPHLADSPERRKTGNESHTATSIWIRNIDPQRRTNSEGKPHTGLLSDACQNRHRDNGRHNCGWSRISLASGGFGLKNGESAEMSIAITQDSVEIRADNKSFAYKLKPPLLRVSEIDTIAIGHTNISRGYKVLKISGLSGYPRIQLQSESLTGPPSVRIARSDGAWRSWDH